MILQKERKDLRDGETTEEDLAGNEPPVIPFLEIHARPAWRLHRRMAHLLDLLDLLDLPDKLGGQGQRLVFGAIQQARRMPLDFLRRNEVQVAALDCRQRVPAPAASISCFREPLAGRCAADTNRILMHFNSALGKLCKNPSFTIAERRLS